MCEFHNSNSNGLGDIWWTDKCMYFSSIDYLSRGRVAYWRKHHRHTNLEVEGRDGTCVAIHHRAESGTGLAEKWHAEALSQRQNTIIIIIIMIMVMVALSTL